MRLLERGCRVIFRIIQSPYICMPVVHWARVLCACICVLCPVRGYCVRVPAYCAMFCARAYESCLCDVRVVRACVLFVFWIWKSIWYPIHTLTPTIGTRYILTPGICLILLWIKCLVSTIFSSSAAQFELILLLLSFGGVNFFLSVSVFQIISVPDNS